jgi:hypothetical protein
LSLSPLFKRHFSVAELIQWIPLQHFPAFLQFLIYLSIRLTKITLITPLLNKVFPNLRFLKTDLHRWGSLSLLCSRQSFFSATKSLASNVVTILTNLPFHKTFSTLNYCTNDFNFIFLFPSRSFQIIISLLHFIKDNPLLYNRITCF